MSNPDSVRVRWRPLGSQRRGVAEDVLDGGTGGCGAAAAGDSVFVVQVGLMAFVVATLFWRADKNTVDDGEARWHGGFARAW